MDIAIYVICKAAYDKGILYGQWINAEQDPAEIRHQILAFLAKSPVPKANAWLLQEYRGFYDLRLSADIAIEQIAAIASFIRQYEDLGAKLILQTLGDVQEAKRLILECFLGHYEDAQECVQDMLSQMNANAEEPPYDLALAWDIFHYGCFSIQAGGFLYVFSRY